MRSSYEVESHSPFAPLPDEQPSLASPGRHARDGPDGRRLLSITDIFKPLGSASQTAHPPSSDHSPERVPSRDRIAKPSPGSGKRPLVGPTIRDPPNTPISDPSSVLPAPLLKVQGAAPRKRGDRREPSVGWAHSAATYFRAPADSSSTLERIQAERVTRSSSVTSRCC